MAIIIYAIWLSLFLLFYVYAGFPALVVAVGWWRRRRVRIGDATPTMSLIIAAYNEAPCIAKRLDNALSQAYPDNALEIIVASDGSNDATEAIVASYASRGVRLLPLPRGGKIPALNAAVVHATGEILVFSDANTLFEPRALHNLARNFADPEVGGVAGRKVYTQQEGSDASSQGEHLYWSYDVWLKQMESLTGSIVSADGAIYAIRRELYQPLTDQAVTDDFTISTAVVEQGRRLVFEPEARAIEFTIPTADREFHRKVRLMTRGLRGLLLRRRLLNPLRYGFYAVVLGSHKLLRRLVPLVLLLLFSLSLAAGASNRFYAVVALAQLLFYVLASLGYLLRRTCLGRLKCLYVPFYYGLANAAALVAIMKVTAGTQIERWEPQRHDRTT